MYKNNIPPTLCCYFSRYVYAYVYVYVYAYVYVYVGNSPSRAHVEEKLDRNTQTKQSIFPFYITKITIIFSALKGKKQNLVKKKKRERKSERGNNERPASRQRTRYAFCSSRLTRTLTNKLKR